MDYREIHRAIREYKSSEYKEGFEQYDDIVIPDEEADEYVLYWGTHEECYFVALLYSKLCSDFKVYTTGKASCCGEPQHCVAYHEPSKTFWDITGEVKDIGYHKITDEEIQFFEDMNITHYCDVDDYESKDSLDKARKIMFETLDTYTSDIKKGQLKNDT